MSVVLFRIDDRLIHGQVMTAWTKVYQSTNIICADDDTAKNEMICSIMKMAVPSDYQVLTLHVSEQLCDMVVSLPMHPYLSEKEILTVCEGIREFFR